MVYIKTDLVDPGDNIHLTVDTLAELKRLCLLHFAIYFVCQKETTYETRKNDFCFLLKALFILEIIKF